MNNQNMRPLIELNIWSYILSVIFYIFASIYLFLTSISNPLVLYGIGIGAFIFGVGIFLIQQYKSVKKRIEAIK
jgi:predicted membrane protein